MPVLVVVVNEFASVGILGMSELSGAWIYYGVLAGIALCGAAVKFMRIGMLKKLGLLFLAATIIVLEVPGMGAFYLCRDGLSGVQ